MKIEMLRMALRCYAASAECPNEERNEVFEALDEIAETLERYDSFDMWKGRGVLIPLPALIGILNETTYDDYGRLARSHNGDVPFDYYANEVRAAHTDAAGMLTDRQLHSGYYLVNDLWTDNEANGDHNDDGTFKYRSVTK